jgi:hypothetical protein
MDACDALSHLLDALFALRGRVRHGRSTFAGSWSTSLSALGPGKPTRFWSD